MRSSRRLVRATSNLLLICALISCASAAAEEPAADDIVYLPAGSIVYKAPLFDKIELDESAWMLKRKPIEDVVVDQADLVACRQALKACEARTVAAPPSSFWSTTTGKVLVGVAGAALFGGGVYLGTKF